MLRAYLGAASGRMLELLRSAEDAEHSVDRVDREPGDDVLEAQVHCKLNIELTLSSRNMVLQQGVPNFSFGASEDRRKGIDRLETQIRQYETATKKKFDDDTRT